MTSPLPSAASAARTLSMSGVTSLISTRARNTIEFPRQRVRKKRRTRCVDRFQPGRPVGGRRTDIGKRRYFKRRQFAGVHGSRGCGSRRHGRTIPRQLGRRVFVGRHGDFDEAQYPVTVLDGNAARASIEFASPAASLEAFKVGTDVVVQAVGAIELFRSPVSSLSGLVFSGDDGDNTLSLDNLDSLLLSSLTFDGKGGKDTLRLSFDNLSEKQSHGIA